MCVCNVITTVIVTIKLDDIGLSFYKFEKAFWCFFSEMQCIGQNPLHQFPHSSPQQVRNINDKSVTSLCSQKSVVSIVSVVSCRFPNSITTTCCQLVADLLAVSLTSLQQVGNFPVYGEVTGKRV